MQHSTDSISLPLFPVSLLSFDIQDITTHIVTKERPHVKRASAMTGGKCFHTGGE